MELLYYKLIYFLKQYCVRINWFKNGYLVYFDMLWSAGLKKNPPKQTKNIFVNDTLYHVMQRFTCVTN